jgi:hypothetical protein
LNFFILPWKQHQLRAGLQASHQQLLDVCVLQPTFDKTCLPDDRVMRLMLTVILITRFSDWEKNVRGERSWTSLSMLAHALTGRASEPHMALLGKMQGTKVLDPSPLYGLREVRNKLVRFRPDNPASISRMIFFPRPFFPSYSLVRSIRRT